MAQNNVDSQYLALLQDIITNGVWKNTRSGMVKSVFGRTMRFNLKEGLPLLTTKKVYAKGIIYELLWFLSGNTNIKYLVDNNVHIWDDDSFRWFKTLDFKHLHREESYYDEEDKKMHTDVCGFYKLDYHVFDLDEDIDSAYAIVLDTDIENETPTTIEELKNLTKEQFIEYVRQNAWIHRYDMYQGRNVSDTKIYCFGDMGDIYGKQWRHYGVSGKDQIQNIINTLKTNPDDRRMVLSAWNPDVIDDIALPACHMFATFWTRKLTNEERIGIWFNKHNINDEIFNHDSTKPFSENYCLFKQYFHKKTLSLDELMKKIDEEEIPTRELSCSFTMRSNDICCGNPFNVCQWGLLTEMFAHCCNMVTGELIYNGNDIHIYENHIELAKKQLANNPNRYASPKLWLNPDVKNIDDFTYNDIKILDYQSYPSIKYPLSVG